MNTPHHQAVKRQGWVGLVRSDWVDRLPDDDLLALATLPEAELVRDRRIARTYHLTGSAYDVYLKHVTGLKDVEEKTSLAQTIKWRFGPSRALRVLRNRAHLEAVGIQTPPVLLAVWRANGLEREELIITQAVAGQPFDQLYRDWPDTQRMHMLIEMIGQTLAQLHMAGYIHGDFGPGNLLVTPGDAGLVLIDNDRTRRCVGPWAPLEQRRNLVQMGLRLTVRHGFRVFRILLDAYDEQRQRPQAIARRERARVVRATRARLLAFIAKATPFRLRRQEELGAVSKYRWQHRAIAEDAGSDAGA